MRCPTFTPTHWTTRDGQEEGGTAGNRGSLGQPDSRPQEGWQRFVNTPARIPPESLTRTELGAIGEEAFDDYNRQRREWHANLGSVETPQLAALLENFPGLGMAGIRCDPAYWR